MAPRWRLVLALALAVIAADQATKVLAVQHLTPGIVAAHLADQGKSIESRDQLRSLNRQIGFFEATRRFYSVESPCSSRGSLCPEVKVIDGFWSWRYAENTGAAFSLFQKLSESIRIPMFLSFTVIAVIFILSYIRKLKDDQRLVLTALSLILGGAIGNFLDRVHVGYVVDFIFWYAGSFRWPVFNIADSAIVVGGGLIALSSILEVLEQRRQAHASVAES